MVKNVNSNAAVTAANRGEYVSPEVKVVLVQPEGVLCSSVQGIDNEDFTDGGNYEF